MSSSSSRKMISLRSSEGETFVVEEDVIAGQSQFIKHMIEDGYADAIIPLPNVTSDILIKLIQYCTRHATSPTDQQLKAFDKRFVEVDQKTLFDLIMAANYLNMKELLNLGCQTVADMIQNKSPEQIRKIFNIQNDYTEEEEEEVRRQHAWAFE